MTVVMRLKVEEHRKCVEEHRCPTVAKAMRDTPCRLGATKEQFTPPYVCVTVRIADHP